MKRFFLLVLIVGLTSCETEDKSMRLDEGVLDKEIKWRLDSLSSYTEHKGAGSIDCGDIHERIQNLILLSKDKENTKASVELANKYLEELIQNHQLNSSGLIFITRDMSSSQISYLLKQNELSILNTIMLQKLNIVIPLKAVQ